MADPPRMEKYTMGGRWKREQGERVMADPPRMEKYTMGGGGNVSRASE